MATEKGEDPQEDLVRCDLCATPIWIRKDRLEQHMHKVHSPTAAPKKSYTTYTAKIASTFPPRVSPGPEAKRIFAPGSIKLLSRNGQRAGKGICAECGLDGLQLWHYAETSQGPLDLCGGCKSVVYERSFGTE